VADRVDVAGRVDGDAADLLVARGADQRGIDQGVDDELPRPVVRIDGEADRAVDVDDEAAGHLAPLSPLVDLVGQQLPHLKRAEARADRQPSARSSRHAGGAGHPHPDLSDIRAGRGDQVVARQTAVEIEADVDAVVQAFDPHRGEPAAVASPPLRIVADEVIEMPAHRLDSDGMRPAGRSVELRPHDMPAARTEPRRRIDR
jgi:hypothetical protein